MEKITYDDALTSLNFNFKRTVAQFMIQCMDEIDELKRENEVLEGRNRGSDLRIEYLEDKAKADAETVREANALLGKIGGVIMP